MAEYGKQSGGFFSELSSLLCPAGRKRKAKLFLYGFLSIFVACTIYIAFCPSSTSPWLGSFFSTTGSYQSQVSSILSRFFPISETTFKDGALGDVQPSPAVGYPTSAPNTTKGGVTWVNQTSGEVGYPPNSENTTEVDVFGQNQNSAEDTKKGDVLDNSNQASGSGAAVYPSTAVNITKGGVLESNQTSEGKNQTSEAAVYPSTAVNTTKGGVLENNQTSEGKNQTSEAAIYPSTAANATKGGVLEKNQTSEGKNQTSEAAVYPSTAANATKGGVFERNQTDGPVDSHNGEWVAKNLTNTGDGSRENEVQLKNQTGVGVGWTRNSTVGGLSQLVGHGPEKSNGSENEHYWTFEGLEKCDLFRGRWVRDESYPLYKQGSCPYIDESFNCFLNGRPDRDYQKLRWKPDGCNIPRLNATDMLERLRGKRLVFVGDSLNRNMWESLVCVLRNSINDKTKVFEVSGRHEFKTDGAYSVRFKDYGCSVEFFRSPFLVQEWEMSDGNGQKRETLRLDIIDKTSSKFKDADIIVFNTGHWWTHEKTSKGKDYYQEGDHVYSDLNVMDAYRKALKTWGRWLDAKVDPKRTMVFFRGFSATHFSGGQWNSGGQCDHQTEPITDDKFLHRYPAKMEILESVLREVKTNVNYLNITRMSDYRKEGHPSIYRNKKMTEAQRNALDHVQDCSHWCLPGVPDSWNELLYAQLLLRQHQRQQQVS